MRIVMAVSAALTLSLYAGAVAATSVLMVSVDGMKPEYVTEADRHGLKVPFLRSLVAQGTFADGVTGVWPTNTYPSHTALVTGVAPAEHGIYNNLEFDPRHKFADAWFWYAEQIRVPTLWRVAHQAGMTTASVGWPVTVGATDIDFLIPEYWRVFHPTADLNPSDRYLIGDVSRPEGLLRDMQSALGPYLMGNDTSLDADEIKTRFAIELLRKHKPRFMTVHLSSLDEAEHEHGPFSVQANQNMEAIDGLLARLVAAARMNDPTAIAIIVSDHGFTELTHRVNLYIPFVRAGLIDVTEADTAAATITAWRAQPWLASGMAAVLLKDPADAATRQRVRDLLHSLATDPANGIADILEHDAIARRGGFPDAAFLVVMKPGFYTGGNWSGEVVTEFSGHGGHGFAPTYPEMRSAFFAAGSSIARGRDLGVIDMRQIAPTVAGLLGLMLTSSTAEALPVRQ